MDEIHKIYDTIGRVILVPLVIILLFIESRFQLRKRVQSRWRRVWTNILLSIPSFAMLRIIFIPLMIWLAIENETLRIGINFWFHGPFWFKFILACLILDYGNYFWHWLNHHISFLWRFHLVHHTDLDLDVTTAFRFHFGELIGSLFFRGIITMLSGASPVTVLIYEIIFEGATQFHHSNWRLKEKFDRILNWFFVTPRMHGIHHSMVKKETDSNYSVIFSFWDRIHKTLNVRVKQNSLVIGVPSYNNASELSSWFLLKLPFTRIRSWKEKNKDDKNILNED